MARILVSIVTENNLPNYLFIKQMEKDEGQFDQLIFMITDSIKEHKHDLRLFSALGLPEERIRGSRRITLDSEDYKANVEKLEAKFPPATGDTYTVNLTGGTKALAQSVHDAFAKCDSRFFTISQNGKKIFDFQADEPKDVTLSITLVHYLAMYGMKIAEGTADKRHASDDSKDACYFKIKRDLGLTDDYISFDAELWEKDKGNESTHYLVDMMFINPRTNELCTVKCVIGDKTKTDNVRRALYNTAATSRFLGLRVSAYIFWMRRLTGIGENAIPKLRDDVRLFGLKGVVTKEDFARPDYLIKPGI